MHLFGLNVAVAALLGQLLSVNASLAVNRGCQKNDCLSAVKHNRQNAKMPGCTSFFRSVVIPPIATKHVIKHSTKVVTHTVTETDVDVVSVTALSTSTVTAYTPTTVATVTVTGDARAQVHAREEAALDFREEDAKKKSCPTAPATKTLPSYASVCQNTDAYSSACSCISAPHQTTTQSTCTTTLTFTKTTHSTAITTTHVHQGSTTTVATVDSVVTVTEASSVTVTTTTTTTSSVCPTPSTFQLDLHGGGSQAFSGQALANGVLSIGFTQFGALYEYTGTFGQIKAEFSLDQDGHLFLSGTNTYAGTLILDDGTTVLLLPNTPANQLVIDYPVCTIGPLPACNTLTCVGGVSEDYTNFAYCPSLSDDAGNGLALVGNTLPVLGSCNFVTLTVSS